MTTKLHIMCKPRVSSSDRLASLSCRAVLSRTFSKRQIHALECLDAATLVLCVFGRTVIAAAYRRCCFCCCLCACVCVCGCWFCFSFCRSSFGRFLDQHLTAAQIENPQIRHHVFGLLVVLVVIPQRVGRRLLAGKPLRMRMMTTTTTAITTTTERHAHRTVRIPFSFPGLLLGQCHQRGFLGRRRHARGSRHGGGRKGRPLRQCVLFGFHQNRRDALFRVENLLVVAAAAVSSVGVVVVVMASGLQQQQAALGRFLQSTHVQPGPRAEAKHHERVEGQETDADPPQDRPGQLGNLRVVDQTCVGQWLVPKDIGLLADRCRLGVRPGQETVQCFRFHHRGVKGQLELVPDRGILAAPLVDRVGKVEAGVVLLEFGGGCCRRSGDRLRGVGRHVPDQFLGAKGQRKRIHLGKVPDHHRIPSVDHRVGRRAGQGLVFIAVAIAIANVVEGTDGKEGGGIRRKDHFDALRAQKEHHEGFEAFLFEIVHREFPKGNVDRKGNADVSLKARNVAVLCLLLRGALALQLLLFRPSPSLWGRKGCFHVGEKVFVLGESPRGRRIAWCFCLCFVLGSHCGRQD
mmetsp:Transcript_8503/g.25189  ORF Transcript_8503/g.25189 Transcript_8503/m.25189 type:complete len:575 (-) Transcript_8503:449-2173(-)